MANINKIAEREAAKREGEAKHTVSHEITKQSLTMVLKNLAEVWTFLYPTKQQKAVEMLVDEVAVGDKWMKMDLVWCDRVMKKWGIIDEYVNVQRLLLHIL